mmetsp:Transcript_11081/g.24449  ORF Transcript_11081/g.24449 Transcript_11081/m.24449 type:complete len:475 (-) Transcript_11081:102-1526(-)
MRFWAVPAVAAGWLVGRDEHVHYGGGTESRQEHVGGADDASAAGGQHVGGGATGGEHVGATVQGDLAAATDALLEQALVGWGWQNLGPDALQVFKGVTVDSMLSSIRDAVPPTVLSALRRHNATGPETLTEAELNQARRVINKMMEGQVTQLDITVIQCKEQRDKTKQTENMVVADLSRLGSKLAREKKRILQAQAGVEEGHAAITQAEGMLREHEKTCNRTVTTLESQLALIQQDLAAANMIVTMTQCKRGGLLLQRTTDGSESVQTCTDQRRAVVTAGGGNVSLVLPASTVALERAVAASGSAENVSLLQLSVGEKIRGYVAAGKTGSCQALDAADKMVPGCERFLHSTAAGEAASPHACAEQCSSTKLCRSFDYVRPSYPGFPGECYLKYARCDAERDAACFLSTGLFASYSTYSKDGTQSLRVHGTTDPVISQARGKPPARKQAFKCSLSKPDCGLLNDNMSIFAGEVSG